MVFMSVNFNSFVDFFKTFTFTEISYLLLWAYPEGDSYSCISFLARRGSRGWERTD